MCESWKTQSVEEDIREASNYIFKSNTASVKWESNAVKKETREKKKELLEIKSMMAKITILVNELEAKFNKIFQQTGTKKWAK